ncbi:Methionyl-tRNA formyltransferase [Slackia heliotrinireducens]|nr:methionyl-tRNA formyltransferase [Slackia heliotrinireducens]VEG99957.1 Methionyl-tRNA formyltransferase [Slackia heliotrinireducens]
MRVVFMGTPTFAANILIELKEQHDVVCVYTRADAVRGRGKALVPSPAKQVALEAGIPVREPDTLRDPKEIAFLKELAPDAIVVAAYGKILPKEVLDIPPFGCINVHGSLLPKYRGAAPMERAILDGEAETGVCIMRMEEGLDTGDYCISRSCEIGDQKLEHLAGELADKGAYALLTALYAIEQGEARWTKQDDSQATYAEKLGHDELMLDPADSAVMNARRVQASSDAHPSKCQLAGRGVTVLDARVAAGEDAPELEPGQVALQAKNLYMGCSDGAIRLIEVKPDGKKAMSAASFAAGIQNLKSQGSTWGRL